MKQEMAQAKADLDGREEAEVRRTSGKVPKASNGLASDRFFEHQFQSAGTVAELEREECRASLEQAASSCVR